MSAILEATIRIFEKEGADAATTTHIAQVAGVSVGTLYQYFESRDAILDSLQDRELERALALMGDVLSDKNVQREPRATVKAVVQSLAGMYATSPSLHRALVVEGLRVTKPERVEAFDLRVVTIVRHFLAQTGARVRRPNLEAAAFVAFQAVRAVMLARLLEKPVGLDENAVEDELIDLVMRYLIDDPPPVSPSAPPTRSARSARPSPAERRRR